MAKIMETTIMGYMGTTRRIHSSPFLLGGKLLTRPSRQNAADSHSS